MDRVLYPVTAKLRLQFPVKPEFFLGSFLTTKDVNSTARIMLTFKCLSIAQNMSHFIQSCILPFMSFPPSGILGIHNGLLSSQCDQLNNRQSIASSHRKSQGSIPTQAWIFSGSFSATQVVHSTARIMFTLKFIVYMKVFLYQIDLILSLIDYDAQLLGYYMQALLQACLLTNNEF